MRTANDRQSAPSSRHTLGRQKLTWIDRVGFDRSAAVTRNQRDGLSHFVVHVAVVLMHYVNNDTGETFVSQAKIAGKLGATVRGVQKALDALINKGYLKKVRLGHGPKTPNLYRLTMPPAHVGGQRGVAEGRTAARPAERTDFTNDDEIPF